MASQINYYQVWYFPNILGTGIDIQTVKAKTKKKARKQFLNGFKELGRQVKIITIGRYHA